MKKVLVIDDNEFVGKLVSLHLGRLGFDVEVCHSPFGVLKKMKEFSPDVVLLDMKMPGLSGRGVASLFRKGQYGFRCKTIIFSSEEEHSQRQMVADGLADGYFVKGSSFEGLKDTIDRVSENQPEAGPFISASSGQASP